MARSVTELDGPGFEMYGDVEFIYREGSRHDYQQAAQAFAALFSPYFTKRRGSSSDMPGDVLYAARASLVNFSARQCRRTLPRGS